MMRNISKYERRFWRYFRRTFLNKVCALALILIGVFSTAVLKEGSILLFMLVFAVPLFFTSKNWIVTD